MMFSKQLLRRPFASRSIIIIFTYWNLLVNPKFPEGTVAGVYKRAVA